MKVIFIHFYLFLEILACYQEYYHKINKKEDFPYQNYYIISTHISKANQKSVRRKRTTLNSNDCTNFHISFSKNDYVLCIQKRSFMDTGLFAENTQIMNCKGNSKCVNNLTEMSVMYVRGHIQTKPYTSWFKGYIDNNQFFGKLQIDSQMFYIEPLEKFRFLNVVNDESKNALIYEIALNASTFYGLDDAYETEPENLFKLGNQGNTAVSGRLCSLLILIDNSFLRIVCKNNTKLAIIMVLNSLDLANAIFRITDFDDDGIPDNIGFIVKYIIVLEDEDLSINKLPKYSTKPIDGTIYLYYLSQHDLLKEVCLGIAFTAQPFSYRALGLSYTALKPVSMQKIPNSGGICERPSNIDFGEIYNNLVITYRLANEETVPQITSDLSLTHELGHSFGSDHDTGEDCYGHLMSAHAFNSTYGHNFMFSPCSRMQINEILKRKGHCLQTNKTPFCGNGLVEENEDCDCGYPFKCILNDPCCIARNTKGPSCKVKKQAGYECHPSQGLCCLSDCQYRDISPLELSCENFGRKCPCENSEENCPCGILGRCVKDKCHSHECTRIGLEECSCNTHKEQKCVTCCRSTDGKCLSSKVQTNIFTYENERHIDYLWKYSVDYKSVLNNSTQSYEKFCVDNKCVTLLFRVFAKDSFCLFKGQLGVCQSNYVCNLNHGIKSTFPVFRRNLVSNSRYMNRNHMLIILFQIFCNMLICTR